MINSIHLSRYSTPAGMEDLALASDGEALTGVHFICQPNFTSIFPIDNCREAPVLQETRAWLDEYFAGRQPAFFPKYLLPRNTTPFRQAVLEVLKTIPYGKTATYGEIARTLAGQFGKATLSAQAVGQAVGWNPLCILIPCHRVIGANGNMIGYGGGLQNKIALLRHEGSIPVTVK